MSRAGPEGMCYICILSWTFRLTHSVLSAGQSEKSGDFKNSPPPPSKKKKVPHEQDTHGLSSWESYASSPGHSRLTIMIMFRCWFKSNNVSYLPVHGRENTPGAMKRIEWRQSTTVWPLSLSLSRDPFAGHKQKSPKKRVPNRVVLLSYFFKRPWQIDQLPRPSHCSPTSKTVTSPFKPFDVIWNFTSHSLATLKWSDSVECNITRLCRRRRQPSVII